MQPDLLAEEARAADADLTRWVGELDTVETEILEAVASRDLERLMTLQARRAALPLLIRAAKADSAAIHKRRSDAVQRDMIEQHEARFAALPPTQSYTDPFDPNSTVHVIRAKL